MLALEKEGRKLAGFGKGGEEVCWLWKRRGENHFGKGGIYVNVIK